MPTYEYQCDSCKTTFDKFQSIKASPLRKAECPKCKQQRPVRRLISTGGAVLFKGSGFYQTDYRSDHYKKAAKSETEKTSPSPTSGDDSKSKSTDKSAATSDSSTKTPAAESKKSGKKNKD